MKTVLITGANGFLARRLAARLGENSWRVIGTVRAAGAVPGFAATYPCALGDSLAEVLAGERVDTIIHAANHSGPGEYRINTGGTRRWFEEARARGVPLQIFLSSLSAGAEQPSDYGRAKRDLEHDFLAGGGVVIRLGLVVGYGGLFRRMFDSVRRLPILPLLDNGRSPVYVVNPDFLGEIVGTCVEKGGEGFRGRIWQPHEPTPHTLREVMEAIRDLTKSRCRFVPLPSLPILVALSVVERLPFLRLPVNATNVRGVRQAARETPRSDLRELGGREVSLASLIAAAAPPATSP